MAGSSKCSISSWLQNLPESFDCSEEPPNAPSVPWSHKAKKRKASHQLTPPASYSYCNMDDTEATSPRKRARGGEDAELTPRPPRRTLTASSTSSSSRTSRSPAPLKKQLMALRLDESGIVFRQLQIDNPPLPAASDLFSDLRDIGNGIEILSEDLRASITNGFSISGPTAHAWRYSFRPGTARDLPGNTPSPTAIILVREWAKHCHEAKHEEAAWGEEVHHRLLEAIFRVAGTAKVEQFNFTSCQTARPYLAWLPQSGKANMIDKCIYYDTSNESDYSRALQELSRHSPTLTVNHTDFAALQLQIILVGIEVKRRGGRPDANLQMATWHAAQWAFLRWAVLAALQRREPNKDSSTLEQQAKDNLSQLPFLIGILVEGHSWAFTISTRDQSKTVHWEDHRFGTTENNLDICKSVAGVRRITAYAKEVYVPWFKKYILDGFM